MTDSAGHKPKLKSSGEKSRSSSSSSKKPTTPDTSTSMSRLDLSSGMSFEVRVLVWEQLEQKLNVVEWEEAKSILGENLIEENKALKEENLALLSIWKEFTHTTNSIEEKCHSVSSTGSTSKSPLPEPPHVRDLLFKQIKFFIDELPSRSKREIVASPREKIVYEYVTRGGALPSRPSTANGSRDRPNDTRPSSAKSPGGTPTPTSPVSPHNALPLDEASVVDTEATRHLLRAQPHLDLDVLVEHSSSLKALIVQEHELLLKDSEFLQFCLEQQADYNSQLQKYTKEKQDSTVPTLQEMKEFNSKLEQKYLELSHSGGSEKEKEKERKPSSSARSRTSSVPDSPSSKPSRPSLPSSSATPSPPRSRTSSSPSSSSPTHRPSLETSGERSSSNSGGEPHVPHPPKEQRPSDLRPRAKLSNIVLSPSSLPPSPTLPLPPVSPPSSISSHSSPLSSSLLPTLTSPSLSLANASPKRTRLKQSLPG